MTEDNLTFFEFSFKMYGRSQILQGHDQVPELLFVDATYKLNDLRMAIAPRKL